MTLVRDKRIALVTGASRGIGKAVALELARSGWRLVAVARAQKALEALDDEIKALGGEATLVPLDLRDGPAIDQLGAAVFERFGRLDGLAACAGVLGALTPAHQATPAVMDEVMAVNFMANWRLVRALHPLLRASDAGRAVFLTSGAAKDPHAYWAPYAASKAALDAFVTSYAGELNITPMKANLFNPGPTRTAMRAKAFPGEDPQTLPTPEDVAPAICDMLAASYTENGAWVQFER
ncbi:MAG: SDR family NAD(P)-dependent oxidoreductase [Hyphomonadaceae bacterium]|nr:SDR family NAD(P)-dependent oxidoreductase [Hyphomonadaceae bacterium]